MVNFSADKFNADPGFDPMTRLNNRIRKLARDLGDRCAFELEAHESSPTFSSDRSRKKWQGVGVLRGLGMTRTWKSNRTFVIAKDARREVAGMVLDFLESPEGILAFNVAVEKRPEGPLTINNSTRPAVKDWPHFLNTSDGKEYLDEMARQVGSFVIADVSDARGYGTVFATQIDMQFDDIAVRCLQDIASGVVNGILDYTNELRGSKSLALSSHEVFKEDRLQPPSFDLTEPESKKVKNLARRIREFYNALSGSGTEFAFEDRADRLTAIYRLGRRMAHQLNAFSIDKVQNFLDAFDWAMFLLEHRRCQEEGAKRRDEQAGILDRSPNSKAWLDSPSTHHMNAEPVLAAKFSSQDVGLALTSNHAGSDADTDDQSADDMDYSCEDTDPWNSADFSPSDSYEPPSPPNAASPSKGRAHLIPNADYYSPSPTIIPATPYYTAKTQQTPRKPSNDSTLSPFQNLITAPTSTDPVEFIKFDFRGQLFDTPLLREVARCMKWMGPLDNASDVSGQVGIKSESGKIASYSEDRHDEGQKISYEDIRLKRRKHFEFPPIIGNSVSKASKHCLESPDIEAIRQKRRKA